MSKKAKVEVADVAAVTETAADPQAVTVEAPGDPLPADDGADIVDGVEVEAALSVLPGKIEFVADPLLVAPSIPDKEPIGDPTRWKNLDIRTCAYEIKDRGVIVDLGLQAVFVPATKLVPDINNGFRIVAA